MLDATERALDTGAAIARAGMRIGPLRSVVRGARRALEPARAHGEATRVVAVRQTQSALPEYTGRVTRVALDLIELNEILDKIDIDKILERVDVEKIIERVDVEKIIERVDIQAIIDRVDIEALLDRVDIQRLLDRLDMNEIVAGLDLDALVKNTDLGAIIAQSTGGIASGTVDLVRRQGVGLDGFVARWAVRIRPRRLRDAPAGPPLLVGNGKADTGKADTGKADTGKEGEQ
jgi:hypothetical protein